MKEKEIRVYLIDVNKITRNPTGLSDEAFIKKAEKLGTVYSLKGFQGAFNYDEINQNECYIRFVEVAI